MYTKDLPALEAVGDTPTSHQEHVEGFLPANTWEPFLNSYPDQAFSDFLRRGIHFGFRIVFNSKQQLKPCKGNLKSTKLNEHQVHKYITEEVASGKLQKCYSSSSKIHWSPIGIIPKPHQPGKYCLIINLSAPQGFSINDGVLTELCSLHYTSVGDAASLVKACGRGALMAKLDLSQAYRRDPVHQEDQFLLGLYWYSTYYIDTALPLGLRSAPKVFTALTNALAWAMAIKGIHFLLNYLDDFFVWCPHRCSVNIPWILQFLYAFC